MVDFSTVTAQQLDLEDPLRDFRNEFIIPSENGREKIYLLGNSLGLQPKTAKDSIHQVLTDWSTYGVEGFFEGNRPWMEMHKSIAPLAAAIVGARAEEVVIMNQLTVNLHLMMVSFYKPNAVRNKILCEHSAFPSDQYLLESQVRFHGLDPDKTIIEVKPKDGSNTIDHEDIITAIKDHEDELALVLIGGVNYYSGQLFDIKSITAAAHNAGAIAGFDLAHAAGNAELHLHDWNIDFACWCNYKYLNSGPGAIATAFVHQRYHNDPSLNRFAGWWGYKQEERFLMKKGFDPSASAEGWQLSTPPIILLALHEASLKIFQQASMERILTKGQLLSDYAMFLLNGILSRQKNTPFTILTPQGNDQKGCQVSLLMHGRGKEIFDNITSAGIFADWREPDVIRIAPVPLYNTFEEVFTFAEVLEKSIQNSY